MFWIALAAQLSLPVPDVRVFFSYEDMPTYVMQEGVNRFVSTRTTIRPDGTPQDCTQERGSGDAKLDALTCLIILKRAKVQPAKWVNGSAAYAVVRVPVTWSIGGPPSERETQRAYPADLDITINRLPPGAHNRTRLDLMIAVDEVGRVVGCGEAPKAKWDHTKTFLELVPIACQQMASQFKAIPAKDPAGGRVRSVQTASVVFTTGP
jgi:hypothetical protein